MMQKAGEEGAVYQSANVNANISCQDLNGDDDDGHHHHYHTKRAIFLVITMPLNNTADGSLKLIDVCFEMTNLFVTSLADPFYTCLSGIRT